MTEVSPADGRLTDAEVAKLVEVASGFDSTWPWLHIHAALRELKERRAAAPHASKTRSRNVPARITEYLSAGGLFNPELMDHEKVRDLLIDARDVIEIADRERDACEPFLKEGETPAECIERNRADTDSVLTLLAQEKRKNERLTGETNSPQERLDAWIAKWGGYVNPAYIALDELREIARGFAEKTTAPLPRRTCTCANPEPVLVNHGLDSLCEKCGQPIAEES